jgi:hypothetical protein
LHWDNEATLETLERLQHDVTPKLSQAITEAKSDPADDPFDVDDLQHRNERLQSLLQRAIGECGPEGRRLVHACLMERTARYPMRPDVRALTNSRPRKDAPDAD